MPIPIGQSTRRWPIVTFVFIAVNLSVFFLTSGKLRQERPQLAELKKHILTLAALHPELDMPPEAREFLSAFSARNPQKWNQLQSQELPSSDQWEEKIREIVNEGTLQDEMDSLSEKYLTLHTSAFSEKYTFEPSNPRLVAFVTTNFLHRSWLTLLLDCVFLALAGVVIENVWGRVTYTTFLLLAGAVSLQVHAWTNPGSIEPVLGASGMVAGLMGASVSGIPALKLPGTWFKVSAYGLLPLWALSEIFMIRRFSELSYSMHVGGFVFGVIAAVALRYADAERKPNRVAEAAPGAALPKVLEAEFLMDEGDLSMAERLLKEVLALDPKSTDALSALRQVYWRQNEVAAFQETTLRLCEAHVKSHDSAAAWRTFEEYLNSGAQDQPARLWLELSHAAEELQMYERAVAEYEKIAAAFPGTREAVMAQLRAARIYLKQLLRPELALKLYEAAYASPVPHLDWEQTIETGIREAKLALSVGASFGPRV